MLSVVAFVTFVSLAFCIAFHFICAIRLYYCIPYYAADILRPLFASGFHALPVYLSQVAWYCIAYT